MNNSSGNVPQDFAAWFRLLQTPGVGRDTARRLLAACGSPEAVLSAPRATLCQLAGTVVADALQREPDTLAARLQAALQWLDGGADRHVLTLDHGAWPPALLQSPDPPLLLYVQGQVAALSRPGIAVVGSRNPTAVGLDNAKAFATALGRQGLLVVSGLARGIDAAAHEGALLAPAGTVAVVGTGLDRVYPASHRDLAHRIAANGALVSEFAPGTPPLAENFPQRNRIIAGLSLGTLVVEAALQSGSLITARLASEAGREVFAIPGSIHAPQSKGCHALLKQGAKLVETAADIVEELQGFGPAAAQGQLPLAPTSGDGADGADGANVADGASTPSADAGGRFGPLLAALGHDLVTLDALLARTGQSTAELNAWLLELELDGHVARLPGGLFQRRHAG